MHFPDVDYHLLGPELIVAVTALGLLIADFLVKGSKRPLWWATLVGLGAAIVWTALNAGEEGSTLAGMFVADPFSSLFKLVLLNFITQYGKNFIG